MEIHYRRELDVSYLIIEESMPSEMITVNMVRKASPAGLLHMECRETENGVEYLYAIDGLKSLEGSLGTREIKAAEIRSLMHGLYRVSNELQEYLLEPDQLFLEPGLIYRGKDDWRFCYDPSRSKDFFAQLQALSRYLLRKSDHNDEETSRMAYELFRVCHEENYSFTQIWEALEMPQPSEKEESAQSTEKEGFLQKLCRFMGF